LAAKHKPSLIVVCLAIFLAVPAFADPAHILIAGATDRTRIPQDR